MSFKEQAIKANEAYRKGTPIMTDAEYDVLLGEVEDSMGVIEWLAFKKTLLEDAGTYTHQFTIGSLNKVRYGEGELDKWLTKHKVNNLVVSEKLDGCSFTATYIMGKLMSGASRGNGKTGTDWTEKLRHILPDTITFINSITIRGELVITNDKHIAMGYKNARNGVVGIMNEDKVVPSKLKNVTALVYDALDQNLNAFDTFKLVDEYFITPNWITMVVDDKIEERLKDLFEQWKSVGRYMMDGLVISTADYVNEDVYHPERKIAFKVNSDGIKTLVKGIEWNISKGGLLKPVVLIEAIEIDGTTVQRATGYNAKYILDNGIRKGTIVYVQKSGDVIPKIIKVVN